MNRAVALLVIVASLIFANAHPARAQLFLYDIQNLSDPIAENFDAIGIQKDAELPHGWRIGVTSDFFIAKTHTDLYAGTSGEAALTSNSTGGLYNFASGETFTSTDRAPGFLNTVSSAQLKSLFMGLANNSGAPITELHLSFDIEKYRTGTRATDIQVQYAREDQVWIDIPEATWHYDLDPSIAVINPPTAINHTLDLTNLNVPDQGQVFLRWVYQPSASNNCQAMGIDNVQLSFVPSQQADLVWDGAPGASWDAASAHWKNSSGGHVTWNDNMPSNATFVDGGAGVASALTLSSPRRAGRLTFDAVSKTYTLSGSSLQITGAAGIGVIARSSAIIQSDVQLTTSQTWDITSNLTLSGQLTLNSNVTLTKKGSGNLLLSGSQNHPASSQLKMTEGTLHLASNLGESARLAIAGNPNATDSTVILDADQDLLELSISTADPGLQGLNLASPPASGAFHSLRIHSANLASAKTLLSALIRQTPGDGIYDSSLASHPNSALGIGIINNYILIRPTRMGDINLDGLVTISDFIDLSSNFGRTNVTWQEGDMNGDGIVSIGDFIDLASNFATSYTGETIPIPESDRQTLNEFAADHGTAIPEPNLVLLALLCSLPARRRKI